MGKQNLANSRRPPAAQLMLNCTLCIRIIYCNTIVDLKIKREKKNLVSFVTKYLSVRSLLILYVSVICIFPLVYHFKLKN